jgi:class 3 adenylate cyclase
MTFLFTDIADFTTMAERAETGVLTRVLNAYLDGMTVIVHKHGGIVDKFIGDAVFAIFNAPLD